MSYKCQNRPHPCLIFDSDSDCIFLTLTCLCKQLEPGTLCCCPAGSVGLGCQSSTSKFLRATQSSCLPCRCSASGSVTAARHNGSRGKSQEAELGRSRGILCMPRGKLRHSQGGSGSPWQVLAAEGVPSATTVSPCFASCQMPREWEPVDGVCTGAGEERWLQILASSTLIPAVCSSSC